MKKLNSNDVSGISMVIMVMVFTAMTLAYICVFDIIYTDYDGNPVVCDVEGVYYSTDRPECQKALSGRWRRDSDTIWQGICDESGICTPNQTGDFK